jgi:hypothetical protein
MDAGLGSEPLDISEWEIGSGQSVQLSIRESFLTKYTDSEFLANPNPSNEHAGINDECLYIDIGPEHRAPPILTSQTEPDTLLDDEIEGDEVEEDEVEKVEG